MESSKKVRETKHLQNSFPGESRLGRGTVRELRAGFPLAVVLPPPARGPGTLIPSAQRLVWAAKQALG